MPPKPQAAYDDGSRVLANRSYSLLILLAAPLFSIDLSQPYGRYRQEPSSAVDCAAMGIISVSPGLTPLSQALMLPATMGKRLSLLLKYCYAAKDQSKCSLGMLTDLGSIWHDADLTENLDLLRQVLHPNKLQLLLTGGGIVTLGAVLGFFKPVRLGVAGIFLMVYACYTSPAATLLPSLMLVSFLGGYVMLFDADSLNANAKKAKDKAAKEKAAKEAKARATAGEAAAPSTSTPGKKSSKKRANVQKLYDI